VTFGTDMQACCSIDSRASQAVWAEVHVKERRAAAHASSRALGLPEAVPVEVAVEVRRTAEWVDHRREAEVDLVGRAVIEARVRPVAIVEDDEVTAVAVDLPEARRALRLMGSRPALQPFENTGPLGVY
jgi:hypothetical protein